jgi:hypothetical protein
MMKNISELKTDPDFIRKLIYGNNIIWSLMYYDDLVVKNSHHLTFLKNADLDFYNTAQAINEIDINILNEIEKYYEQQDTIPAFYLDPASEPWLKSFLANQGYQELPLELENWWGTFINDDIKQINFQDYLKIPENHIETKIVNPNNLDELNQFLSINQTASELPDSIVNTLREHMKKCSHQLATNTLIMVYVNGVPASVRTVGLYNNTAYLAEAGTLPEFRKLGLHTYTTFYCLKYAYLRGANTAALTCTHDSVTNFTAKRAGMEMLFQRQLMKKT